MIPLTVSLSAVTFWICAPIMVALALGMVLARKAVHSALCLAGVMVALGVLYASLNAPFLFVAQLIVYTGSVMMLFLFTMMLIGVDTADQMAETIKGQRVAAIVMACGMAGLLVFTVMHGIVGSPAGLGSANTAAGGNAQAVAQLIFGRYAVAFEAASALVITAALAAMVLAHADRLAPKERQRARVERRLREYASDRVPLGPDPASGVYARHNAATYPALTPDGQAATGSVAAALEARGQGVVASLSLKTPAQSLHNRLASQSEDLDGRPVLLADLAPAQPELAPSNGQEVAGEDQPPASPGGEDGAAPSDGPEPAGQPDPDGPAESDGTAESVGSAESAGPAEAEEAR